MIGRAMRVAFTGAMLVLSAMPLAAQARVLGVSVEEIRLDLVTFTNSGSGSRTVLFSFPGTLAFGVYLSDNFAIEPSVSWSNTKTTETIYDDFYDEEYSVSETVSSLTAGLAAPYYFLGGRGRSGMFFAPALQLTKMSYSSEGDTFTGDLMVDFGADFGLKQKLSDNVSFRAAINFRTGDTAEDRLGFSAGFSVFPK